MLKDQLNRIVVRNSFYWMFAMMLPVVAMIILDLFDLHTPARVALIGGLSLFVPFLISTHYLSRELGQLICEGKEQT